MPESSRFASASSKTSTVGTPLMKCWRWLPRAMTTYSFQSSFLIFAWISSDLPRWPVTSFLPSDGPGDLLAAAWP